MTTLVRCANMTQMVARWPYLMTHTPWPIQDAHTQVYRLVPPCATSRYSKAPAAREAIRFTDELSQSHEVPRNVCSGSLTTLLSQSLWTADSNDGCADVTCGIEWECN